jgi:poly(A) polymerase
LLIRYRRSEDGKPVAKAVVYTQAEHGIDRASIDPDALRISERLRQNGHEAYIVGGAVRDLLLARSPKDFDIVTDAPPARIKRVFRSARVIGRRFRLVHVYCGPKIFEVSTFRSIANGTVGNEFGTIDEDARRRDFSLNALYYDPYDSTLVDYVGGFKDIAAKRIEPVIPVKVIFKEDAVRMIRCVKYAAMTGFRIPLGLRLALKRDSGLLAQAGASRLTEEFIKILGSGSASVIFTSLARFDLLRHMLPSCVSEIGSSPAFAAALSAALGALDDSARDPASRRELSGLLAHFLKPFLESRPERLAETSDAFREALRECRTFLSPLNPPRVELESAVLSIFRKKGLAPAQKTRSWTGERIDQRSPRGRGDRADANRKEGQKHPAQQRPSEKSEPPEALSQGAKRRRRRKRGKPRPELGPGPLSEGPESPAD